MSFVKKALKIVAVVAAVALAIPSGGTSLLAVGLGVSAVAATAIAAGLMVASSLLNKPKVPPISQSALSRLNISIDPRTPRKIVFGETAMACDLRDMEYLGENEENLAYFVVTAAHKIDGYTKIYFDDKLAWAAGVVQPDYAQYLTVQTRAEGAGANTIYLSPRMGNTRRYTGLAYVYLNFRRTGLNEKANSPFASGIPSRMTIIGRGIACYDPRQDSTVEGGSGPMRASNQATWTYGEHARNPACQMLTYFLGWRINGRLSVGRGLPPARLDLPSFMAAANACDVPISLAGGGTQPRYRSDGIFSESDGMESVIEIFKATMNAELDDSAGKIALRMLLDDLDDPIAHFAPEHILSGVTWRPVAEISDRPNRIAGQYVDPRELSLYQLIDYPEVAVASVDGIERTLSRSYPMVQNPSQAQRTAKEVLQRQQYGGLLEFTVDHTGWRVQKYDIVTVTFPPLGFEFKLFRVAAINVGTHGQVSLTLREENAAIYAWDRDELAPVQLVAPVSYNYRTNPVLLGLEELVTVSPPSPPIYTVQRSWDGLVKPGQLPAAMRFSAWRDTTEITTSDDVTYYIDSEFGGLVGNVTLDSALGSPNKGVLSISEDVTLAGGVQVFANAAGTIFGPFLVEVRFATDPPPSGNSLGGGTDSSLGRVSPLGSPQNMIGTDASDAEMAVTVSAGGGVQLSVSVEYIAVATGSFAYSSGRLRAYAEISGDGGATWTAMAGGSVTGSFATYSWSGGAVHQPGALTGSWAATGLAAGTYRVRLMGLAVDPQNLTWLQPTSGQAVSSREV